MAERGRRADPTYTHEPETRAHVVYPEGVARLVPLCEREIRAVRAEGESCAPPQRCEPQPIDRRMLTALRADRKGDVRRCARHERPQRHAQLVMHR